MRRDIKNNLVTHTRSKGRRPGLFSDHINERPPEKHPADDDKRNRENVRKSIEKYLDEGKSLEEAVDILASDEKINKQFEYLKKHGINLRDTFKNWYLKYQDTSKNRISLYK